MDKSATQAVLTVYLEHLAVMEQQSALIALQAHFHSKDNILVSNVNLTHTAMRERLHV